ncbi:MAG: SCO family protein [Pseudomonadota bacterium]
MVTRAVPEIAFDAELDEYAFAAYVDDVRAGRADRSGLLPLLHSGHCLYAGRGLNQVARMRGYLLASFEHLGLPGEALHDAFDVLQNSQKPYLVAAAARALRGLADAGEEVVLHLRRAITNIQYRDEALSFDCYAPDWPRTDYTTALQEIVATLRHLGAVLPSAIELLKAMSDSEIFNSMVRAHAAEAAESLSKVTPPSGGDCCSRRAGAASVRKSEVRRQSTRDIGDIVLEDQEGHYKTFAEAFGGRPTMVGFFYTRCGNPNKCSLTVTKLGRMKAALKERGLAGRVNVAAMTYDPGHDTAERLEGYCGNRDLEFDDTNRAWRADPRRFSEIRQYFDLGASYVNSVVSRHDVEMFLLDERGELRSAFTKMQWEVAEAADHLAELLTDRPEGPDR